jgi:hypothetical protein
MLFCKWWDNPHCEWPIWLSSLCCLIVWCRVGWQLPGFSAIDSEREYMEGLGGAERNSVGSGCRVVLFGGERLARCPCWRLMVWSVTWRAASYSRLVKCQWRDRGRGWGLFSHWGSRGALRL